MAPSSLLPRLPVLLLLLEMCVELLVDLTAVHAHPSIIAVVAFADATAAGSDTPRAATVRCILRGSGG